MANIFEEKDRRVIPNWRSFKRTVSLGELNSSTLIKAEKNEILFPLDDYIFDFKKNLSLPHAGDLISAAISNGIVEHKDVINAAKFILSKKTLATNTQITLAKQILFCTSGPRDKNSISHLTVDTFTRVIKKEILWKRIKEVRQRIQEFPYNPLLYVELSRYHSILGQEEKAKNAMKIALHLSPNNRFILRCAVRLFAHYDDIEFSHDLLRKNPLSYNDPWLTSAEIAIATIRERSSRFIKRGLEMIDSKKYSPFSISELSSSIATVELLNGNNKKSRALFKHALIEPNDNTLAQVEWASKIDGNLSINPLTYKVKSSFEALSIDNFQNQKFKEALDNTFRWLVDQPFTRRPIMLGAHIAGALLNDQQTNREFLFAGLISHPNDPQIINNIVYSFALENEIEEAKKYLEQIKWSEEINEMTNICLTATRGLLNFRTHKPELGRKLYMEAIEKATLKQNQYYISLALLNWAREEILNKSADIESIMDAVYKIPEDKSNFDVSILQKEVIKLFQINNL